MKTLYSKLLLGVFILASVISPGQGADAVKVSKLKPLGFLIGSWHGDLPSEPDGPKAGIESKFEWAENHQAIRFDSNWVMGDKHYPYVSGMYYWDPEKSRLSTLYTDAQGELVTGYVDLVGEIYQHELRLAGADGKIEQIRAKLTTPDTNTYVNEIFKMNQDKWEKLVEVKYVRVKPPGNS